MGYKNGTISEDQYTRTYKEIMRNSFKNNHDKWMDILNKDELCLTCYCRSGEFCHRYILRDIFEKICNYYEIEFEDCGEI